MQSRREIQRENKHHSAGKTIKRILYILLAVIMIALVGYFFANQPRANARRQTVNIAKRYAHLHAPGQFYIYNRENTYYTISGRHSQNQPILVIVPQHGGDVRVLKQSAGLTAQQVEQMTQQKRSPEKILKVAPGVFNDKVVWEVTYRNHKNQLCYDLINFKTGKYVQEINNL